MDTTNHNNHRNNCPLHSSIEKENENNFSTLFLATVLLVVIPILIITFSCIDERYLEKDTPYWLIMMGSSTIGNLPVINSIDDAQYHYSGELFERWEISYKSKSSLNQIQNEIESYLIRNNANLNARVSCYNGYWNTDDDTVIISAESENRCIKVYLDDEETHVSVRAFEID